MRASSRACSTQLFIAYFPRRSETVQGWSSFTPHFAAVDFVSFYIEIPVMIVMYLGWILVKRPPKPAEREEPERRPLLPVGCFGPRSGRSRWHDLVDIHSLDLKRDEYQEVEEDRIDDAQRHKRLEGRARWLWRAYYWVV